MLGTYNTYNSSHRFWCKLSEFQKIRKMSVLKRAIVHLSQNLRFHPLWTRVSISKSLILLVTVTHYPHTTANLC
jgi:hypothetical protein